MKKMGIYLIAIVIGIIIIFFTIRALPIKTVKPINTLEAQKNKGAKSFLSDINLHDGNYALYVNHKKLGEFMVLDNTGLIKNKDSIQIKTSWTNYFPGEGKRKFGLMMFKDNQLIKAKTGGIFKVFEIGGLKNYGVPVKRKNFTGVRSEILSKIDSLRALKSAYIFSVPKISNSEKEFNFRVYFPSMAIPVSRALDSNGYEKITAVNGIPYDRWIRDEESKFTSKWYAHIENNIRKLADTISDFKISVTHGTLSGAYLTNNGKSVSALKNAAGSVLNLNDFMYYNFNAYIEANSEDVKKLMTLNYSACLSETDLNKPELAKKINLLVKQSTTPSLSFEKGDIGLYGYKDQVLIDKKPYQQEYSVYWLEVINN